jgi:hypothetical protein
MLKILPAGKFTFPVKESSMIKSLQVAVEGILRMVLEPLAGNPLPALRYTLS